MGLLPPGLVAPTGATPVGYGGYYGGLGGIAAGLSEGVWLSSTSDPTLCQRLSLAPGSFIEVTTQDQQGIMDGTALLKVEGCYFPDAHGLALEA
eukprot:4858309-Karenia_brevis.AAC.1